MAVSVRIEDEAFSDVRYDVLATLCLLADSDHARGKMAVLWRQCTAQGTYVLPESVVRAVLGANAPCALIESGLGEAVDGGFRIKGTRGRIEWLKKLRKNAQKGGKAKAAKRQTRGKQEAAKSLPPPFPPAPAPAPAPANKKRAEPPAQPPLDLEPKQPAAHQPAVAAFHAYFRGANGGTSPTWDDVTIAMMKTLVGKHTCAEVVRRIEIIRTAPPVFPPQPWDLKTLVGNFDKCAQPSSGQKPATQHRHIPSRHGGQS